MVTRIRYLVNESCWTRVVPYQMTLELMGDPSSWTRTLGPGRPMTNSALRRVFTPSNGLSHESVAIRFSSVPWRLYLLSFHQDDNRTDRVLLRALNLDGSLPAAFAAASTMVHLCSPQILLRTMIPRLTKAGQVISHNCFSVPPGRRFVLPHPPICLHYR